MPWSHCDAEIADSDPCPSCGLSKAEWTIQLDRTRTFKVGGTARRKKRDAWIEVQLLGPTGQPVAGAPYKVRLHDGRLQAGELDGEGKVRLEELAPGTCEVEFPGHLPAAERDTGAVHVFRLRRAPLLFSY